MKKFSQVATPPTCLTCKDKIKQNKEAQAIFKVVKTTFNSTSMLYCIGFYKAFLMERDS